MGYISSSPPPKPDKMGFPLRNPLNQKEVMGRNALRIKATKEDGSKLSAPKKVDPPSYDFRDRFLDPSAHLGSLLSNDSGPSFSNDSTTEFGGGDFGGSGSGGEW